MEKERKAYIDYLKAFAIILVVFGHGLSYWMGKEETGTVIGIVKMLVYDVHVPLFFVVAGFLCRKQPVKEFYRKKVFRLLIPFIVFTVMKLVYLALFEHPFDLGMQLYEAFIIGARYWFPVSLMEIFLIMPLLWKDPDSAAKDPALWVFAALFLYNLVGSILHIPSLLPQMFQLPRTVSYLPYFLGGFLLRRYGEGLLAAMDAKKEQSILFASLAAFVLAAAQTLGTDVYSVKFPLAIALMVLLRAFAKSLPENARFLKTLSRYSLQIMFWDSFFKTVLFAAAGRLAALSLPVVLAETVLDLALSVLVTRIAERIPVVRTLVGL